MCQDVNKSLCRVYHREFIGVNSTTVSPGVNSVPADLQHCSQRLPSESVTVGLCHCVTLTREDVQLCLCRSVGFKPSKKPKAKILLFRAGVQTVFNLCILLNDPSKTTWKPVDFESFQLSALSNQTPPNVQTPK